MGLTKKVTLTVFVLAAIGGISKQFSGKTLPPAPKNRCEDRIASRLPQGAFIVTHTEVREGESKWLIDHNGIREGLDCTLRPDGTMALTALGHD